jgi:hypothetical protein
VIAFNTPNWILAVAAIATFLVIWQQLRRLEQQAELATRATRSQLYGIVSEAMRRIGERFHEHPEWRPFFYEGKEYPTYASPDDRVRIDNFCEALMDLVDAVVEQKRAMPESMDWSTWDAYFRFLYANSPKLRSFVDENEDFYPDYIVAALGMIRVRRRPERRPLTSGDHPAPPTAGEVINRWEVRELRDPDEANDDRRERGLRQAEAELVKAHLGDPGKRGYPWVRTWLFYPRDPVSGTGEHMDGRGRFGPSLIADVDVVSTGRRGTMTADVRVRRIPGAKELGPEDKHAIRWWLLASMERTGIRKVMFDDDDTMSSMAGCDLDDFGLFGPLHFGISDLAQRKRQYVPRFLRT